MKTFILAVLALCLAHSARALEITLLNEIYESIDVRIDWSDGMLINSTGSLRGGDWVMTTERNASPVNYYNVVVGHPEFGGGVYMTFEVKFMGEYPNVSGLAAFTPTSLVYLGTVELAEQTDTSAMFRLTIADAVVKPVPDSGWTAGLLGVGAMLALCYAPLKQK